MATTRERMLETTGRLLQHQGYAATGLNQVVTESRAPKGSLYFHFPGGKEQLAAEALERSGSTWAGSLDEVLASARTTAGAMRRWVRMLATQLEATDFAAGCPVATVALEAAPRSDAISTAATQVYQSWVALIRARLEDEGVAPSRARTAAVAAVAAIEGALVLAKSSRDTTPLRQAETYLRDLLS
jgi:TetR/AcrR family transcriptional repressor of lmrAB and yxaGH operons